MFNTSLCREGRPHARPHIRAPQPPGAAQQPCATSSCRHCDQHCSVQPGCSRRPSQQPCLPVAQSSLPHQKWRRCAFCAVVTKEQTAIETFIEQKKSYAIKSPPFRIGLGTHSHLLFQRLQCTCHAHLPAQVIPSGSYDTLLNTSATKPQTHGFQSSLLHREPSNPNLFQHFTTSSLDMYLLLVQLQRSSQCL